MSYHLNLDSNRNWLCAHNAIVRGAAFAGDTLLQNYAYDIQFIRDKHKRDKLGENITPNLNLKEK